MRTRFNFNVLMAFEMQHLIFNWVQIHIHIIQQEKRKNSQTNKKRKLSSPHLRQKTHHSSDMLSASHLPHYTIMTFITKNK